MPGKPKRPCRYKGCPNITDNPRGYCDVHAKLEFKEYDKFIRDPESRKRYGYQWKKIRARFLNQHPLCEMCRRQGRYTAATEVHHIKPLAEGGTNDFNNLMALCKPCHSSITITATNRCRGG